MGQLDGKIVIVTGATSGIGKTCSELFALEGASVVLVGRTEENGKRIEAEILARKQNALFVRCDVTQEDSVQRMVDKVVARFGRVDALFNNAGLFLPSVELDQIELDAWKQTFDVNLNGYFLVTKYAKPHLLRTRGVILNNASIAGMNSYAMGRAYAYSASKAAVIQLTRMMAKNYAEEGIRVNAISPGVVPTPMMHGRDPRLYEDRIPMRRLGTTDETAQVALFLISDKASYVTGVNIPVDGGASL